MTRLISTKVSSMVQQRSVVCLLILLVLCAENTPAREWIVSKSGDDRAPGTVAAPVLTIGKACSQVAPGDVIIVHEGVYREPVRLEVSGTKELPIVLKNYPNEHPVIETGLSPTDGGGKRSGPIGVLLMSRDGGEEPIGWLKVEGMEIRHAHDGVKFRNAHDIVICNCHIHDNWNQGILGTGNRVLIDRNVIARNGNNRRRGFDHGIYGTGTAFVITNNVIRSNLGYGIQVAAYGYEQNKEELDIAGPEYALAKDWWIANNTLAFNESAGIVLWQDGVENCVVQNNIFYKNINHCGLVLYDQRERHHPVRNNVFYPRGEYLISSEKDAYVDLDNRQADPDFVAPDSFDFELKADSPAIDVGIGVQVPKADFAGRPRSQGVEVDAGAYEFTTASRGATGAGGSKNEQK
jgi:parallel beta helix pectate lyase-like protein